MEGFRTSHKPCHGQGRHRSCTSPHKALPSLGSQKDEGRRTCSVLFPHVVFLRDLRRASNSLPTPNNFLKGFLAQESNSNCFLLYTRLSSPVKPSRNILVPLNSGSGLAGMCLTFCFLGGLDFEVRIQIDGKWGSRHQILESSNAKAKNRMLPWGLCGALYQSACFTFWRLRGDSASFPNGPEAL